MQKFKDDTEALLQLTEGNIHAYRYLFYRHFSDLCNFLLIYLLPKELSEEIALDIFTYVWEKRETLQIRSTFKSFLFAAAKNKGITLYRKEHQKIFSQIIGSDIPMPANVVAQLLMENDELRDLIERAIHKLPEKSRQVYQMAWEENLSYSEITSQPGLSPKTVENHIGIALRKLRELLRPYYKQISVALNAIFDDYYVRQTLTRNAGGFGNQNPSWDLFSADVLLIYAEAMIEMNSIGQTVFDAMNLVCARAYGVDKSATSLYPAIAETDQSKLRRIIIYTIYAF